MDEVRAKKELGHLEGFDNEPQSNSVVSGRALAAWEIVSVSSSFLIAAWTILPFVGNSKLIGLIPVGLAFALMWLSHRARLETAREIGWRLDNFFEAARLLILPMLLAAIAIVVVGWLSKSLRFDWALFWRRFLWLPVWGFMQEYVMQGFINRRAQIVFGKGWRSILLVAALFAVFHLPNPWLALATFAGGLLWASVYQRAPNLLAIGLSHGLMSLLLASQLPNGALNSLRVGFKYFGYN
jgi:membrane protease YdiL (CAAX protease family)